MAGTTIEKHVASRADRERLESLRAEIDAIQQRGVTACIVSASGKPVELTPEAFAALKAVVESMANGLDVTVIPHGRDLTTQEAADLLRVSRPHLVKLLDDGVVPHHKVGSHRRVKVEDALAYRERLFTERQKAIDEIFELSRGQEV